MRNAWIKAILAEWQTVWVASRLSLAFFPVIFQDCTVEKRTCRWINALLKDILCNKFMKMWALRKHLRADWSVLFSFVLFTILLDSVAQWSIGKIPELNHCTFSSSKATFVSFLPLYYLSCSSGVSGTSLHFFMLTLVWSWPMATTTVKFNQGNQSANYTNTF